MKKCVAIYGGSFNPIHFGHIGVAKWVKEHTAVDEVWLMVSPNNPLKDAKILAPEQERFDAVKESVKDIPGLVASDFEFGLSKPSYTADTLRELTKVYPEYKFILIIGEDSLDTFHKWKDHEYIAENFIIYVYPRRGYNKTIDVSKYPYMKFLYSAPYFDISSTEIRNKHTEN